MDKDKHVCNPQATTMFRRQGYQCGCGRYWFDEDAAIEQQNKYYESVSKEFEDDEDKD